jgi:DNA-binding HxlR family transcriptional regulator
MKQETHTQASCTKTLKVFGDFWNLSIIGALRAGELRFCELQRHLGMLNPVTLTNRLQTLEEENIVERKTSAEDKIAVMYSLTKRGKDALKVLDALDTFAAK